MVVRLARIIVGEHDCVVANPYGILVGVSSVAPGLPICGVPGVAVHKPTPTGTFCLVLSPG